MKTSLSFDARFSDDEDNGFVLSLADMAELKNSYHVKIQEDIKTDPKSFAEYDFLLGQLNRKVRRADITKFIGIPTYGKSVTFLGSAYVHGWEDVE